MPARSATLRAGRGPPEACGVVLCLPVVAFMRGVLLGAVAEGVGVVLPCVLGVDDAFRSRGRIVCEGGEGGLGGCAPKGVKTWLSERNNWVVEKKKNEKFIR